MEQYQKNIQASDQEIKEKAQKIQDLLQEELNPENQQAITDIFAEFQSTFKKPMLSLPEKKEPKKKGNGIVPVGTCSVTGAKNVLLYGKSKCCYEAYCEGELDETIRTLYAKEKKFLKTLSYDK